MIGTSRWVSRMVRVAGDLRIRYLKAGAAGSTVVLLHGAGLDSAALSWGQVIEPLAQAHTVLAPDLPGYGRSEHPPAGYSTDFYVRFVLDFLDVVGSGPCSLVGLSLGGAIALGATLTAPERIHKLVLVDSYGLQTQVPQHRLSYLAVNGPLLTELTYWWVGRSEAAARATLQNVVHDPRRLPPALSSGERGTVWTETRDSGEKVLCVAGGVEHMDRRVHDFLKREARKDLQKAAQLHAAELGVRVRRISIRDQSSRWGSCTSAGSLSFSWRLILAPPPALETVVVHELAHLRVFGHGPRFWELVATRMPDHARWRRCLRDHAFELHAAFADEPTADDQAGRDQG